MQPNELVCRLIDMPMVWDAETYLDLTEEGRPELCGWVEKTKNSLKLNIHYQYINGKWVAMEDNLIVGVRR